ncbi:MAG: FKBP-type peptidyl-prolyl cis-trans isomerase [Anaerolineae bacterium]|nr:FKBP-type peptidyl-prolyl cis-trans isomerase [Thermoflexales bacterium]MDW8408555.1 FKBP-type peptidyl-prolyl cis-trans isomerase [Anaerolineae bacterium]
MTKQEQNVWMIIAGLLGVTFVVILISAIPGRSAGILAQAPQQQAAAPPPAQAVPQSSLPQAPTGNVVRTASGLEYIDEIVGSGAQPQPGQTVVVHYTGYLDDGTIFDSSVQRGQPAEFPIDQVIPGFREGVLGMKVGGKRRLIIPPELGYGAQGQGPIPPNARLTFDVELLQVK